MPVGEYRAPARDPRLITDVSGSDTHARLAAVLGADDNQREREGHTRHMEEVPSFETVRKMRSGAWARRLVPKLSRASAREAMVGYLLILPWLVGYLGLIMGPTLASGVLAFTRYDIMSPPQFVGLRNFQEAFFQDSLFWQSLKVTGIYTIAAVPLRMLGAFTFALLLNQNVKGLSIFRTVYYLPAVVSGVAVAFVWKWLLDPNYGLVNALLYYVGIQGPQWFASPDWALPSFIIVSLWTVGGSMITYLAGLQSVPTTLYEAAEIDGAGRWRKLVSVTIPMISPVLLFEVVITMIHSFQVFTAAYVITNGGPMYSTLFYLLYLYQNGFKYLRMGYASALAWVLFVIILGFTILTFRLTSQRVYYEGEARR